MEPSDQVLCPHCHEPMRRWANPPLCSWSGAYQWVCFNDECAYFVRGWTWMRDRYNVNASYRHRLDPATGEAGPLPVWSAAALRERIVDEEEASHA